MDAILNYSGTQWAMEKKICALMPDHRSYLNQFFGSGAVLVTIHPSTIETVNDGGCANG